MFRPNTIRRSRRLLAVATVVTTGLALIGAGPATAVEPAAEPLALVSDDGSVTTLAELGLPSLRALPVTGAASGFAGTGVTGNDGADHTVDPTVHETVDGPEPGGPGTMSVIGTDGRARTTPTTNAMMHRAVVMLTTESDGTRHKYCSGWLFGADTVITAGHCVYNRSTGKWRNSTGLLRVWPGRDGTASPYGSCTVRSLHTVTGWTERGDPNYDIGAMKLNCTVGNTTGWPGIWTTTASLDNVTVFVRGYPGDKTYGTQWWHGDIVSHSAEKRLYYRVDTAGGQSGSPVYNQTTGNACTCVLAIHAYGTSGTSSSNSGPRITRDVADLLWVWRDR